MLHVYKYLLPLAGLQLLQPACRPDDFGNTNNNPGAIETPLPSALLTSALANTPADIYSLAGLYCQYFSQTGDFTNLSRYELQGGLPWDQKYSGHLYDLQEIIRINSDPALAGHFTLYGSNNNQIAVARILLAYNFASLTNSYGDIPYSQALTLQPYIPYDPQADIYKSLLTNLREAVAQFDNGQAAEGDILFGGDLVKWKKLANSLRLILALQMSNAEPDLAKMEFNAVLSDSSGIIEANSDNAVIAYPGGTTYRNPWFITYLNGQKPFGICLSLTDTLQSLGDPRLTAYGQANSMGKVIGVPYGLPQDSLLSFTNLNPGWSFVLRSTLRAANSPIYLLTAAHVWLARAEAAQRGWTTENAANLYRMGIQASFEQWAVYNSATFNTYMSGSKIALGTDDLKKIQLQQYLAYYPNGLFGWNTWRRTGVPALQPTPFALNASGQIPRRILYPNSEINLNSAAWAEAVARMGGTDSQDSRVWWDK